MGIFEIVARRVRPVTALWAAVLATALCGCAAGQITQTGGVEPNGVGAHVRSGDITVLDALVLPAPDGRYQKGASAPLDFWISNDDPTSSETLTGITADVGAVTVSSTVTIPPESIVHIGGDSSTATAAITHLTRGLTAGTPVSMTFSFAHASTVSLQVPIKVPSYRVGTDRPSANIYPEEAPNLWETNSPPRGQMPNPEH